MIRRPPRSTLFPYTTPLPICSLDFFGRRRRTDFQNLIIGLIFNPLDAHTLSSEWPFSDSWLIWRRSPSHIEQPWTWDSPEPRVSFAGWNDSHPDRRRRSPNNEGGCQNISGRHFESKTPSQYLFLTGLGSE